MERLLNIKEAAAFLNVSEMTLRRWTNDGSLSCYRVGKRRARRFRPKDLVAFLENRQATAPSKVLFGFDDVALPDDSHVVHLSTGEDEAVEVAAAFIAEGLQGEETVCVVAPGDKAGNIERALRQKGTRVENFVTTGRLHWSRGMDSPGHHARYLRELAARCGGRFRIFGDMTWTGEKAWSGEDLRRLEESVHEWEQPRGRLLLCQYPLHRFAGTEIMMAMETHTHNIYRGQVLENPFRHSGNFQAGIQRGGSSRCRNGA